MPLHEWIADKILANVSEKNHADFLEALKDKREALIDFYCPHMEAQMCAYTFEEEEMVTVNADPGDPNCFYTLAKKAVDHLRDLLLEKSEAKLLEISDFETMSDEDVEEHILSLCLNGQNIAAIQQYRRYKHARGEEDFTLAQSKAIVDALTA